MGVLSLFQKQLLILKEVKTILRSLTLQNYLQTFDNFF